jgi:hypothetical protein
VTVNRRIGIGDLHAATITAPMATSASASFSREAIVMFSRGLSAAPVSHHALGTGVDTERAVGGAAGP